MNNDDKLHFQTRILLGAPSDDPSIDRRIDIARTRESSSPIPRSTTAVTIDPLNRHACVLSNNEQ